MGTAVERGFGVWFILGLFETLLFKLVSRYFVTVSWFAGTHGRVSDVLQLFRDHLYEFLLIYCLLLFDVEENLFHFDLLVLDVIVKFVEVVNCGNGVDFLLYSIHLPEYFLLRNRPRIHRTVRRRLQLFIVVANLNILDETVHKFDHLEVGH